MVNVRSGLLAAVVLSVLVGSCARTDTSESSPTSTVLESASASTDAPTTITTARDPTTTEGVPTTQALPPQPVYTFPVVPAESATYARSHHDYPAADIFAPCGSDVVAPTAGTVQEVAAVDVWNHSVNAGETRGGLSFALVGADGVRYYGSHLQELDAAVGPGVRVETGTRIGAVGDSGNAKGSGCHLHFGISTPCGPGDWQRRRGEVRPQEHLDAWRAGGQSTPQVPDSSTC